MRFLGNVPRSSTGTLLERSFFIVGWGKKWPFIHPSAKTHYAGARVVPCSAMPSLLLAHEGMVSSLLRDMQRLPQQKRHIVRAALLFFWGEGSGDFGAELVRWGWMVLFRAKKSLATQPEGW